jgi:hypothetical protein
LIRDSTCSAGASMVILACTAHPVKATLRSTKPV